VRQSAVSIKYFSNLQEIARIVADSCRRTVLANSDSAAVARCSCVREEDAKAMFARCLNRFSLDDEEVGEALAALRVQCSTNPYKGIASLIASFAFAIQH
jgi:hypothetical protein